MEHVDHFAEAFSTEPGLCYRLVQSLGGQPQQCRQLVVCQGRYRGRNGRWHSVWACEDHQGGLVERVGVRTSSN
jgi:hypothetical protein